MSLQLIGATRKTGGSNWGPPTLARASRRGLLLRSSLNAFATLAAPKGAHLYLNGSSYSLTLSLSTAISCFSCSLMYLRIVSSFNPTVLT